MTNIINDINNYVNSKITPYALIRQNIFQASDDETEEIICRTDPSSLNESTDLSGKKSGAYNFSYYAKSIDQLKAETQLNDIIRVLNLSTYKNITNILSVKIDVLTSPLFVSFTEKQEYVFTCSFRLSYIY